MYLMALSPRDTEKLVSLKNIQFNLTLLLFSLNQLSVITNFLEKLLRINCRSLRRTVCPANVAILKMLTFLTYMDVKR